MNAKNNDFKSQTLRNTRNLGLWTLAWVLSMALATFGPKFLWESNKTMSLIAIVFNLFMGFMMIRANMKLLNGLDELQRKLQIDAMAVSLGIAVVGGLGYSLLDQTNIIPWDAEIGFLVMLIGISYFITLLINQKRYQ